MKYAVIDLEWIKYPYQNIVQIGGILFDESHTEISRFYEIIRPAVRISDESVEFMHLTAAELNSGVSISAAARRFVYWLGGCSELIVWGDETQKLLQDLLFKYEGLMYHKIISLSSTYESYVGNYSFEKNCRRFGIDIRKPLHISINDCEYLGVLYRIFCDVPQWVTDKTVFRKEFDEIRFSKRISSFKYIALSDGKAFHRRGCRYIANKSDDKKILILNSNHAVSLGYVPCKCCKPSLKIHIREKWDYDKLEEYCCSLNLECRVYPKWIYVISGVSTWFFKASGNTIVLHHENKFKQYHSKQNKWKFDYHDQQKRFDDPFDAVYYIYCHDRSVSKRDGIHVTERDDIIKSN